MSAPVRIGDVSITSGARAVVAGDEALTLLARHGQGDWGTVCAEDRKSNDDTLACGGGGMLLSSYQTATGEEVWIITLGNPPATSILLPEEY